MSHLAVLGGALPKDIIFGRIFGSREHWSGRLISDSFTSTVQGSNPASHAAMHVGLFCHWFVRQTLSNLNSFYSQTGRQPTGQRKQDGYKVLGQCGSEEPC